MVGGVGKKTSQSDKSGSDAVQQHTRVGDQTSLTKRRQDLIRKKMKLKDVRNLLEFLATKMMISGQPNLDEK